MIEFSGRTAFVTGGANGVGLGLVRALLAQGCRVAIADIRQESIEKTLKSLDNQMVMGVQVDVSSREEMARAADAVEAKFGPVTLLFNNAGINLFQSIEESSWSDWDWVMGVNLHGPINGVMTF
ncbi:MAG TPA: SDR family NAD(P)-dependent oxidoreductase, partial [Novosphingobium sp.]|nr:SDR family NAD(P)-dependent oxidoreductase [Novosphingobium sp.]